MAVTRKKILSGMRPTGKLHLGHLVGTLENWARLQREYECFFMVADWHAYLGEYENPQVIRESSLDNVIDWLAAGIDPQESTLFVQSSVDQHLELQMVFSALTPLGLLERCPTYKEQMREITQRNLNTYGFLGYPVLQAADILLYKADNVPVGEDQLPHLELTREIARKFNGLYNREVFPYPEAMLTTTPRLPGLDGRKMSKSYNNTINLSDDEKTVLQKVQTMVTDPARVRLADKGHPDVCTVYSYYGVFASAAKKAEVFDWCTNAAVGCTECKKRLAGELAQRLAPIQERRRRFAADPGRIRDILAEGCAKARTRAAATMEEVRAAIGL